MGRLKNRDWLKEKDHDEAGREEEEIDQCQVADPTRLRGRDSSRSPGDPA